MRRELAERYWRDLGPGRLIGPDGATYSRRTTRIDRREAETLAEGGCPVVTYLPGGRLVWADEDDGWPAWADARSSFTTCLPGPGEVTGGRWESAGGGTVLVLVRHD